MRMPLRMPRMQLATDRKEAPSRARGAEAEPPA